MTKAPPRLRFKSGLVVDARLPRRLHRIGTYLFSSRAGSYNNIVTNKLFDAGLLTERLTAFYRRISFERSSDFSPGADEVINIRNYPQLAGVKYWGVRRGFTEVRT
jgi:hypothetical protein